MRRGPIAAVSAVVVAVILASCDSARPPPASSLLFYDAGPDTAVGPSVITLPVSTPAPDPVTCDEAESAHSYVGCDYWPTVLANVVWSYFDYAVVLGNAGTTTASVTVTGPGGVNQHVDVAPGTLEKIVLPWVKNLKGPDVSSDQVLSASVVEHTGAYHIVSSVPVVAYQFSALEYTRTYEGTTYDEISCPKAPADRSCFSFTNDASLLLPSTAWTQSYRITSYPSQGGSQAHGANLVVTAATDATKVTVVLSTKGAVVAGGGIAAASGGGTITQTLNAGDVMELVSPGSGADFSGSLVTADKPIEVFTGDPCIDVPSDVQACDHIEESVVPAESLGKDYIITPPVGPNGAKGAHLVRFYGNRDGTTLNYAPSRPAACPATLAAGEVADCGLVSGSFVVQGNQEFGVAGFGVGADHYANNADGRGDPDQTVFASALQFRTRYLFLAPDDYEESYAVVTGPITAGPSIDGTPLTEYEAIEGDYGVWRAALAKGGSHTLTSVQPVGLQVMGYGSYTSYTYPGGLSVGIIAPPPVVR